VFDLDEASDEGREFYRQHIEPADSIIGPDRYDIVIFQDDLGDTIAVEFGSMYILQVESSDKRLADQTLWFYGQPEEFYLILRYESPTAPREETFGFVVSNVVGDYTGVRSP
jgi:hypothetical protein